MEARAPTRWAPFGAPPLTVVDRGPAVHDKEEGLDGRALLVQHRLRFLLPELHHAAQLAVDVRWQSLAVLEMRGALLRRPLTLFSLTLFFFCSLTRVASLKLEVCLGGACTCATPGSNP